MREVDLHWDELASTPSTISSLLASSSSVSSNISQSPLSSISVVTSPLGATLEVFRRFSDLQYRTQRSPPLRPPPMESSTSNPSKTLTPVYPSPPRARKKRGRPPGVANRPRPDGAVPLGRPRNPISSSAKGELELEKSSSPSFLPACLFILPFTSGSVSASWD